MSKFITKARAGVTLVELLVVILIVTILSVGLLPLLKPYIVKAQYAAEPIPVIGNLRTQIGLFQYDKNYLPGLPKNADGEVMCDAGDETTAGLMSDITEDTLKTRGGVSRIALGTSPIQTFCPVSLKKATAEATEASLTIYRRAVFTSATTVGEGETELSLAETLDTENGESSSAAVLDSPYLSCHFAKELGINYEDLTGKRMKPVHVQYRVLYGGYKSGTYAYAIGVFGDANGLAAGTGYAVLEIVNPDAGVKYVGTWERYKTISGNAGQIKMVTADEDTDIDADSAATANVCWLGDPNEYLKGIGTTGGSASSIATDVAKAIANLTKAGWEFK